MENTLKLSERIKNVINLELENKVSIRLQQSEMHNRVRKLSKHHYLIEMDYNNFDEDIFLHECMHISQFENGYPKLSTTNIYDNKYIKIIIHLQDLVLDTWLNRILKDKYCYESSNNNNNKFIGYLKQINKITINNISQELIQLLAIEISYIYFNCNKVSARKLLNQIEKKSIYDISKLFYKISDILIVHQEPSSLTCNQTFKELISLLELEKFCSIVSS